MHRITENFRKPASNNIMEVNTIVIPSFYTITCEQQSSLCNMMCICMLQCKLYWRCVQLDLIEKKLMLHNGHAFISDKTAQMVPLVPCLCIEEKPAISMYLVRFVCSRFFFLLVDTILFSF